MTITVQPKYEKVVVVVVVFHLWALLVFKGRSKLHPSWEKHGIPEASMHFSSNTPLTRQAKW